MTRSGQRLAALAATTWLVLLPASAQTPLYTLTGDSTGSGFGQSVAGAGDVNGDGFDDVIVGAPHAITGGFNGGIARVYSGLSGSVLHQHGGTNAFDFFGNAVAGIGDVNGDGFDDYAVAARGDDSVGTNAGAVHVFSGKTHKELFTHYGNFGGDALGTSLAGVGDVDLDGIGDLAAGIPGSDGGAFDGGGVRVISGRSGGVIFTYYGTTAGERMGTTVAPGGDLDKNSYHDLLAAGVKGSVGRVVVISGKTGKKLLDLLGNPLGDGFGRSLASVGDTSGDGIDDFLMGAPSSNLGAPAGGAAFLYSGADASLIRVTTGDVASSMLGMSVAPAGDVDGDGVADYAIGVPGHDVVLANPVSNPSTKDDSGNDDGPQNDDQPQNDDGPQDDEPKEDDGEKDDSEDGDPGNGNPNPASGTLTDAGQVRVYSGRTGALVYAVDGKSAGGLFGWSTARVGDANQDGIQDLVSAALLADRGGAEVGSASVFSVLPLSLAVDQHLISLSAGGSQVMRLDMGPSKAGFIFWVVGGGSGTYPGVSTTFGHLQLNIDPYLAFTLKTPKMGLLLPPFGVTDAKGVATSTFAVSPGSDPQYAGVTLHHVLLLLDPVVVGVGALSNAVPITLLD